MLLAEILFSMNQKYSSILNNPNDHYLQIAYTQIDRNSNQEPIFTLHTFNVDNKKYFYPASTVKFPKKMNCVRCGFVSSNDLCKACVLLEGLNKGTAK